MSQQWPDDAVLIARGKYATLRSDHRATMKHLQAEMSNVNHQQHAIMRLNEQLEGALDAQTSLENSVKASREHLNTLADLNMQLSELRPLAWGKEKPE